MNAIIRDAYTWHTAQQQHTHTRMHCQTISFRFDAFRFSNIHSFVIRCTNVYLLCVCSRFLLGLLVVFSRLLLLLFSFPFRSLIRYFQMLHHSDWMHVNACICNSLIVAIWFIICFYCYFTT